MANTYGWYSEQAHKDGANAYWYETPHGGKVLITASSNSSEIKPATHYSDLVLVGIVLLKPDGIRAAKLDTGKRRTKRNALV